MDRIAIAVDGSPASMGAVRWVAANCAKTSVLAFVDIKPLAEVYDEQDRETGAYWGARSVLLAGSASSSSWNLAANRVRDQAVQAAQGLTAEWHELSMSQKQPCPAALFLDFACWWSASLLVVGRHHGPNWIEGILGSFPKWVVTHGHYSTVIIPPPHAATS